MFGRDKTRMSQWLLLSLLAYVVAAILAGMGDEGMYPRAQTVLWKVGHLNLAAYLGYWIDRNAFRDRLDPMTPYLGHIRRAIIMAATMIAFGMAL
jgi:hypothetical protein